MFAPTAPQLGQGHGEHPPVAEREHIATGVEQHAGLEILAAAIREPAEAPSIAGSGRG